MIKIESTSDLIPLIFSISFIVTLLSSPFIIYYEIKEERKEKEEKEERFCYLTIGDCVYDGVSIRDMDDFKEFKTYFSEDNFNGAFFIPDGNSFIMNTIHIPAGTPVTIYEAGEDLIQIRFKNKWYNPDSYLSKRYTYAYIPENQLHTDPPPAFPCEQLTEDLIKNKWVLVDLRIYENDESLYPCLLDSVICFTDSAVEYSSGFYVNNEKKIFADYQITGSRLSIKKSETLIHHFKIDKLSDDSLVLTDSVDGYTFQFKKGDQNESRLDLVTLTYSVKDMCDFPDMCPDVYQIRLDSGMNFYLSDDNEGEISSGISKEKYQYFMHRIAQIDWQKMADTVGIYQFPRTIEVVQIEYVSNGTLKKSNVTINSESCPIMLRMLLNGLKYYKNQLLTGKHRK